MGEGMFDGLVFMVCCIIAVALVIGVGLGVVLALVLG